MMHNENKLDEMCTIMEGLHKYVPSKPITNRIRLESGETLEHHDAALHQILLVGDQLTVARARGAQAIRASHDTNQDRLKGLIPAAADWHTRVILLQVCILHVYTLCDCYTTYRCSHALIQFIHCTDYLASATQPPVIQ